jgi:pSer/pThr/pTyr-binding forkhead associated (FHA) protein
MSLKSWILHKMDGLASRSDLRSPVMRTGVVDAPSVIRRDTRRRTLAAVEAQAPAAPHLGPYAPLIAAIRDELEHFVLSQLRLHLAIAERDRFRLTSIEVRANAGDGAAELLRRFIAEFKPEQIKHYVAKELIGALPNASAIDLSQFAGLNARRDEEAEDDGGYSELLAELGSAKPGTAQRPYTVSLVGHWSEFVPESVGKEGSPMPATAAPRTGRGAGVAIEDANGSRHVTLPAVLPGRRYAIGKGEGCDVVVNGLYTSRRHCEIWFERGSWWVTDAGSTNGVRVENASSVLGRSTSGPPATGGAATIEVPAGARIVLSARADGAAAEYPRLLLEAPRERAVTPVAPGAQTPATPSTPIVTKRLRDPGLTIAVRMASGVRTVPLRGNELPFSIGRSRSQSLVIDWTHEGVSGHHIDISDLDEAGATVVVHGDNGVNVAGTSYAPGARLLWKPGESMALGKVVGQEPECRLTLSRTI